MGIQYLDHSKLPALRVTQEHIMRYLQDPKVHNVWVAIAPGMCIIRQAFVKITRGEARIHFGDMFEMDVEFMVHVADHDLFIGQVESYPSIILKNEEADITDVSNPNRGVTMRAILDSRR